MPNIESGNILHKAIVYLSEGQCAGCGRRKMPHCDDKQGRF